MANDFLHEINPQELISEVSMLWTVAQFFSTLQATMLQEGKPLTVDLQSLYDRLEKNENSSADELRDIIQQFRKAQVEISMIDAALPPAVFRRFFERISTYDRSILLRIICYYVKKLPKSDKDRDKLDLLATRLCTHVVQNDQGLKLMICVSNFGELLESVFPKNAGDCIHASIREATLNLLRRVSLSITDIRSFNALISAKLVTQLRQSKINLGDIFYTPSVLTEIVAINVAVHNKFQELYSAEQARLRMESARLNKNLFGSSGKFSAFKEVAPNAVLLQITELILQMQRLLQDFRQEVATRVLNDRQARMNLEEDNTSLVNLVGGLEDSLKRSRSLIDDISVRFGLLANIVSEDNT